jgi:hypothetical protein
MKSIKKYPSLLVLILCCSFSYAQKPQKCNAKKENSVPSYKLGSYEGGSNSSFVLRVSLNPSLVNQANLISLAAYLKKVYCKENEIIIGFFDDYQAAKYFTFNENSIYFKESLNSSRGEYYFNLITGEEYLEFTLFGGYLKKESAPKRTKIVLSKKQSW